MEENHYREKRDIMITRERNSCFSPTHCISTLSFHKMRPRTKSTLSCFRKEGTITWIGEERSDLMTFLLILWQLESSSRWQKRKWIRSERETTKRETRIGITPSQRSKGTKDLRHTQREFRWCQMVGIAFPSFPGASNGKKEECFTVAFWRQRRLSFLSHFYFHSSWVTLELLEPF